MKWTLIAVAVLVVLIALPIGIGSVLPEDHTASSYVELPLPADTIWSVVRDFEAYSTWWPEVRSTERLPDHDGREAWKHVQTSGDLPIDIVLEQAPTRLVTRIIDDGMPFGGTWTYSLTEAGGRTRITITEDGQVHNPLFRFMSRFVFGHHGTVDRYLEALAAAFGETAVPVHVGEV